jgi:hypothetical protein
MTAKNPATSGCPPAKPTPPPLPEGPEADDRLARLAKALGHPARVAINPDLAFKLPQAGSRAQR